MYTRRDGSARYAPLCTRACRSSILRSKSASYASHVSPSTPAAAFILSSRNASSSSSTLMWCRSAVNFSCFILLGLRPWLRRLRRGRLRRGLLHSEFVRFVHRLLSYYDGVRLPALVRHRLRLLAFPMRAASPLGQAVKRRISQVPTRSF